MRRPSRRRTARPAILAGAVALLATGPGAALALGQAMLADDVIILSKGQRAKQQARMAHAAAPSPGAGQSLLPPIAGAAGTRSGGVVQQVQATRPTTGAAGVLSAASGYSTAFSGRPEQPRIALPPALPGPTIPQYGTLEVPRIDDEGPPDGLTLDAAIDRLVHANPELAARFREIPKAQADVLTAGLIANPIVFASADAIPYGSYSPQRPGSNNYGIVLVQPLDVNRKRKVRVIVAEQAKRVIEAQYQDEVRLAIDRLYAAFVDVLEARENVRFKGANLDRLNELVKASEELYRRSHSPRPDLDRALILRDSATVEVEAADGALLQASQALATLLALPPAAAHSLRVRGSVRDNAPPPPSLEDLLCLARLNRPDLVAYRLGVQRARSEVRLARAERFEDVFLFYTPYGFANNAWENQKSATSWSLGALVSIPLFNRNQGNIARADEVVIQTQAALNALERQAVTEVERAWQDYRLTRSAVEKMERIILPRAARYRDDQYQLFTAGETKDVTTYYEAQRDYNDIVRQYFDALIRHRRSMLRLNTAVGHRVLP